MATIDVHTHHYPPEARSDPRGWAQARDEGYWAELVTEGPQGWASDEEFLTAMDAAGLDEAVLLAWYWQQPETCREQNAFFATCRRAHPRRWRVFAAVQPRAGWGPNEELLEQARADGFCGIGEVNPAAQGFSLRDPAWLEICAWAQRHRWPINLHVTEAAGHAYPGRLETPLMDYVWLAEQFPQVRFILAHWGGGLPFFCLNRRVRKALRNCFFDSAASPLLYRPEVWKTVCGLVGAERVLFGSDFPLRLRPRTEAAPSIATLRRELEAADLGAASVERILGANARELWD